MRALLFAGIVAGCGGGGQSPPEAGPPIEDAPVVVVDAGEPDHGFNTPVAAMRAHVEQSPDNFVDVGPADLSCLGTPSDDEATTVTVSLTTTVRDFQSDNLVPGAQVTAFAGSTLDTDTSDGNGNVTLTIPFGTTRFNISMTEASSLDTVELFHILVPNEATQTLPAIRPFSKSTAQTLPALIGISRTSGTGMVVAQFLDCQGRAVSNFIATVTMTAGGLDHFPGADTYYFSSSVGLPVRHSQQQASSGDGRFMVIELQPGAGFISIWGFPTDTDVVQNNLVNVGRLGAQIVADSVAGGTLKTRRL